MRIGIFLGRFPALGGGIKIYAQELVRNVVSASCQTRNSDVEFVIYGDSSVLDKNFLEEMDRSPQLVSFARKWMFPAAKFFFGVLPNGCRSRILFRLLPEYFGRHLGYVLDQMMIHYFVKLDNLDIVHSVSNTGFASGSFAQVITVHDLFQGWPPEYSLEDERKMPVGKRGVVALIRVWYRWLFRRQFALAKMFIVDSEQVAKEIRKRFSLETNRLRVIPLGLDSYFAEWIKRAREKKGWLEKAGKEWLAEKGLEAGYVVISASLDRRKNSAAMLKAWQGLSIAERSNGLVILISDPRSNSLVNQFLGELKKQGFDLSKERITIVSRLMRWEMPLLYRHASVVVVASLAEGFGLPALEAMSVGSRVVTAHHEYLEEIDSAKKYIFLCEPEKVGDITKAIGLALAACDRTTLRTKTLRTGPNQKSEAYDDLRDLIQLRTMEQVAEETFKVYRLLGFRAGLTKPGRRGAQ